MEIGRTSFTYVCAISPTSKQGKIVECRPAERYKNERGLKLNRYGNGPFCKFRIPKHHSKLGSLQTAGVYALVDQSGIVLYIGSCVALSDRFYGYGQISPRNCYEGGQLTNCRINNLILKSVKQGCPILLFFHPTPDGEGANHLEATLLNTIHPSWNKTIPSF